MLAKVCPECGGSLSLDSITKNFICRGCGLYAPREKFDELQEKLNKPYERSERKEDYLEWWQSSKKDKKNLF
jgi:reverse gyrase